MANVLSEQKRQQIEALGRLGWSLRRIEAETQVRRETASKYLRAAGIALRRPGRWGHGPPLAPSGADPAIEVITDSGPRHRGQESACEAHRELIEHAVMRGRNAMSIWQELVEDHAFKQRYSAVQRFVRALKREVRPQLSGVIVTEPGEEGQVDYGEGPVVFDPKAGRRRKTRLFVFTLGYSRKSVRLLTFQSSSETWARLHEEAFRRLGGAPRVVVLDNLKEGVLRPDVYDPERNPLFAEVLRHYGVVALPCRVRDPNRKGKVERGVGHAQQTALKGKAFDSLDEAQAYLERWEERWADTRIHGTVKRQVLAMFLEEKPRLVPLPAEPFRYYRRGRRTVSRTGHVEVEAAYYEAPPRYVQQEVAVQFDKNVVRILDEKTGELLVEHRRGARGRKRPHPNAPRQPRLDELLARAKKAGRHIEELACQIAKADDEPIAVRRIKGVLHLAQRYGAAHVDGVCRVALEVGAPTHRFVRTYLDHHPPVQLTLRQIDPLIRDLTAYRDVIARLTKEETCT